MPCSFRAKILGFQTGVLDAAEADAVAEHILNYCPECETERLNNAALVMALEAWADQRRSQST
jgi:hypothetical protein